MSADTRITASSRSQPTNRVGGADHSADASQLNGGPGSADGRALRERFEDALARKGGGQTGEEAEAREAPGDALRELPPHDLHAMRRDSEARGDPFAQPDPVEARLERASTTRARHASLDEKSRDEPATSAAAQTGAGSGFEAMQAQPDARGVIAPVSASQAAMQTALNAAPAALGVAPTPVEVDLGRGAPGLAAMQVQVNAAGGYDVQLQTLMRTAPLSGAQLALLSARLAPLDARLASVSAQNPSADELSQDQEEVTRDR